MDRQCIDCAFCGISVGFPISGGRWEREFRALHSPAEGGFTLTGVGFSDDNHFDEHVLVEWSRYVAPPDLSQRWDDPGHDKTSQVDLIHQLPPASKEGGRAFLIHDACWRIFSESAPLAPSTRLEPIYEVLNSLLMHRTMLRWGHDYGGLASIQPEARYPWEPLIRMDLIELFQAWQHACPLMPQAFPNNLVKPADRETQSSIMGGRTTLKSPLDWTQEADPISELPEELILLISELLPTDDFLNARLASRAFWNPFDSRRFWLSRFFLGGERSWLFEVLQQDSPYSNVDPQLIYRCSAERRLIDNGLRNRRKVYSLIANIHPLLDLQWTSFSAQPVPSKADGIVWRTAVPDVRVRTSQCVMPNSWPLVETGARETRVFESGLVPDFDYSFTLYFCAIGSTRYLCGIKIARPGQTLMEFGWRSKDVAYYHLPRNSRLIGFGVAFKQWAVTGIQIHHIDIANGEKSSSDWHGKEHDCMKTLRTVTERETLVIRAGFQGCKMVNLQVAEPAVMHTEKHTLLPTLRQHGIWHLDIPSPRLSLNEHCFSEAAVYMKDSNPLFWTSFGGSRGERLSHLTSIEVLIDCYILGIRFGYNNKDTERGVGTAELGRHARGEFDAGSPLKMDTYSFSIDGPGGERITSIRTQLHHPKRRDMDTLPLSRLKEFEVFTNRNRSKVFMNETWEGHRDLCDEHFLSPDKGTAITGFYAYQNSLSRIFSCLGILSEVAPDPT